MADNNAKDTPSTASKAAGKSSAVKPPVLEGTARPAASAAAKSAGPEPSKPDPAGSEAAKPEATKSPGSHSAAPPPPNGGTPWLAGLAGGALGLGAAYALAWFGLWPTPLPAQPAADPRLAQFASAIPELETITDTVQGELATLTSRVSGLETDIAQAQQASSAIDDSALSAQLADLAARVENLTAEPPPAGGDEAGTNAAIATLEAELAALRRESSAADTRIAATESRLAALDSTLAASGNAEDQAARLPLIFSGLEAAFANGRPFEAELTALRQAQPQLAIPEALAARATQGLPRPDDVARALDGVLPDILAGRPAQADAAWQDNAGDWFRGIIAMRPAGAVDGDGPEAIVARLEAALARRDFVAAETELAALPAPMRAASGPAAADIAALAAAATFLSDIRNKALIGENGA